MIVLLSARMSEMTARAPAARRWLASWLPAWLPPTKPIKVMPAATAGGDADRRILHHDAVARLHAHLGGDMQEQIRRRLAVAHIAGRKQIGLEEPDQIGGFQADANAVERGGGRHAFRSAQP